MNYSGTYRHFKGNNYEVLGEAVDKSSNEQFIFYRQLYDPFGFWIRPKEMFLGKRKVGDEYVQRFVKIADGQKDILTKVDLYEIDITHTETKELYKIVSVSGEMYEITRKAGS